MAQLVQPFPSATNVFDENAKKFTCCCGCMHSRLGLQIFTILEMVIYVGLTSYGVYLLATDPLNFHLIVGVAAMAFYIIFDGLTLIGVQKVIPCCLIPYAVMQVLAIKGSVFGIVLQIMGIVDFYVTCPNNTSRFHDDVMCDFSPWLIVPSFALAMHLAFKVWILVLVGKCHMYLRAKKSRVQSGITTRMEAYEVPKVYTYPVNHQFSVPTPGDQSYAAMQQYQVEKSPSVVGPPPCYSIN